MVDPAISVIIPHKNIPDLLERCLSSIPVRDDIEVLVIDDNSDPIIVDFGNFPGSARNNTSIFFIKESKGAGAARNVGYRNAKGRWLMFADADDFFHEGVFDLYTKYDDQDVDLVVFETDSVFSNNLQPVANREDITLLYREKNDLNVLRYMHHSVWGKLFRRDIAQQYHISFQEVSASNDAYFAACYGLYSRSIAYDDFVGYCSTVRDGSICTRISLDTAKSRILVAYSINSLYQHNQVKIQYWMNLIGPIFDIQKISFGFFGYELVRYLIKMPICRIMIDIKESGRRFYSRRKGVINDKDIKSYQKVIR